MKVENTVIPHSLCIAGGKTEIKGICGVASFSDRELCFLLPQSKLTITGSGLLMENLNVESGMATVTGEIESVKYKKSGDKLGLLKKISK